MKNDFTEGSERGTYVRLDTSRTEGTWDGPPGREAQGHGAWIVLVGVTPDQGGQESWPQGEARQVIGVFNQGGIRDGERHNWMDTHRKRREALESAVPGNSQAAFGGGPGEKGWKQYLACGLSYWILVIRGTKAQAQDIKEACKAFLRDEMGLEPLLREDPFHVLRQLDVCLLFHQQNSSVYEMKVWITSISVPP